MCRMTDFGVRWKREIELPDFGKSARWIAVQYGDETRYIPSSPIFSDRELCEWLKPLYAIRVTARNL